MWEEKRDSGAALPTYQGPQAHKKGRWGETERLSSTGGNQYPKKKGLAPVL